MRPNRGAFSSTINLITRRRRMDMDFSELDLQLVMYDFNDA